jgi:hypothetical protein
MGPQVIGAGFGRTGTESLKRSLEVLLGGTCHHMVEVFAHPEELPTWTAALRGAPVDWPRFMAGYTASVDFPSAVLWRDLAEAFPDAAVLLSTRESAEVWWRSADATILATSRRHLTEGSDDPFAAEWHAMLRVMFDRAIGPDWDDPVAVMAAYERHNAEVRASVPAERLIEYRPGDGWGAICERLGLPEPGTEIPHTNTTEQFRLGAGLDGPADP